MSKRISRLRTREAVLVSCECGESTLEAPFHAPHRSVPEPGRSPEKQIFLLHGPLTLAMPLSLLIVVRSACPRKRSTGARSQRTSSGRDIFTGWLPHLAPHLFYSPFPGFYSPFRANPLITCDQPRSPDPDSHHGRQTGSRVATCTPGGRQHQDRSRQSKPTPPTAWVCRRPRSWSHGLTADARVLQVLRRWNQQDASAVVVLELRELLVSQTDRALAPEPCSW